MAQAATSYAEGRVITRPRYTDDKRAGCVLMLEAAGYPENKGALRMVAQSQHVQEPTLLRWFRGENNPAIDIDVNEQRASLTTMLERIANQYAEHATEPDVVADTSARDSAVVMGIAIDKLRLLQELSSDRMARVRRLIAACSMAGYDVDATLDGMSARLEGIGEANNPLMTSGE